MRSTQGRRERLRERLDARMGKSLYAAPNAPYSAAQASINYIHHPYICLKN